MPGSEGTWGLVLGLLGIATSAVAGLLPPSTKGKLTLWITAIISGGAAPILLLRHYLDLPAVWAIFDTALLASWVMVSLVALRYWRLGRQALRDASQLSADSENEKALAVAAAEGRAALAEEALHRELELHQAKEWVEEVKAEAKGLLQPVEPMADPRFIEDIRRIGLPLIEADRHLCALAWRYIIPNDGMDHSEGHARLEVERLATRLVKEFLLREHPDSFRELEELLRSLESGATQSQYEQLKKLFHECRAKYDELTLYVDWALAAFCRSKEASESESYKRLRDRHKALCGALERCEYSSDLGDARLWLRDFMAKFPALPLSGLTPDPLDAAASG